MTESPESTHTISIPKSWETPLEKIAKLAWVQHISSMLSPISVSFEERDCVRNDLSEMIYSECFDESHENNKTEIMRTLDFLFAKFEILFTRLEQEYWISREVFVKNIANHLAYQLTEAKESDRKYTNGTVWSLKRIEENWDFVLEKIPYWAFWSTNVTLDKVNFETSQGAKTLREIMETLGERDSSTWEFYLPNSLWVSVMIQLSDGTIIAQKRNNKATLTQRTWLVTSASWALSLLDNTENWWVELLRANAGAELEEELGIRSQGIWQFPVIDDQIQDTVQSIILRELGLDDTSSSGALSPCGVIMERIRHNPEVVFTLVLRESFDLKYIQKKWENADDKWESIWLVWITPKELEEQIQDFLSRMNPEQLWKPGWLNKHIESLDSEKDWVWPHLLMSYFAWKKAIEDSKRKSQKTTSNILG